jgi:hypothetical protein
MIAYRTILAFAPARAHPFAKAAKLERRAYDLYHMEGSIEL